MKTIQTIRAKEFMSTEVIIAEPKERVSEILGKMRRKDIQVLPIVKGRKLLGIVNYATFVKRRKLPLTALAETIMSSSPKVSENDTIIDVADVLLTSGFRAVPVVEKGNLKGIITRTDLIRAIKDLKEITSLQVVEIMNNNPQTISEDENMVKAKDLMRDVGVRNLPVIDKDGFLVGIFGIKDLAKYFTAENMREGRRDFIGEKNPLSLDVKSCMNTNIISVNKDAKVGDVIELMLRHDISSIIVSEKNKLQGIITRADIIEMIARLKERESVYVQITGVEEEPEVYDEIYEVIQKGIKRISKLVKPNILSIDIKQYKTKGNALKYSTRAKLITNKGMFLSSDFDWNMFKVISQIMKHLETQIRREKEKAKRR